jgi:thiol-disulfide isomerase/thioredoxin
MMRFPLILALAGALAMAQSKPEAAAKPDKPAISEAEQEELSEALGEAGSSPIEFLRAVEKHLAKYPQSPRRPELERAAARAAVEAKDEKRIVSFGERVLERDPDDVTILERVTRSLLLSNDAQTNQRALKYARHFEELLAEIRKQGPPDGAGKAEWQDEVDRALGRALVFQARASANLGKNHEALDLARRSWEAWASAESARELARALERTGKGEDAVQHLADAFTIADARNTDLDRARDRVKMGELYRAAKGSEAGLGDLILQAYDRTTAVIQTRKLRALQADPNAAATSLFDFTVSSLDGGKLQLSEFKGKTLVLDFWATWCGPCRAQHPLYEEVKKTFRENANVIFLSVNSDEDREVVKPFLDEAKWKGPVYFEDNLTRVLRIDSLPTTVIVDKHGEIFSRLNGYVPERFVSMLTERIRDALSN